MRTARSRISAGYLPGLVIAPSSQGMESPRFPGRFNPGRVFDFETTLDHIADAYAAMDDRRAIKSVIRIGSI